MARKCSVTQNRPKLPNTMLNIDIGEIGHYLPHVGTTRVMILVEYSINPKSVGYIIYKIYDFDNISILVKF